MTGERQPVGFDQTDADTAL